MLIALALLFSEISTVLASAAPSRFAQPRPGSRTADVTVRNAPDSIHKALAKAADRFFAQWDSAWKASIDERRTADSAAEERPGNSSFTKDRLHHAHCHAAPSKRLEPEIPLIPGYWALRSEYTAFSLCPSWTIGAMPAMPDEALFADAPISESRAPVIRAARAQLLELLNATSARFPTDGLITGQRVRFLVEQNLRDSALVVARSCQGDGWWCAALQGYSLERLGMLPAAESAFVRVRQSLPDATRCKWDDIYNLLSGEAERESYHRLSCADQQAVNVRYWWLSDPLYIDPGNERHTVHDARQVLVLLHAAFERDNRLRWMPIYGSDAKAKLLLRYGWPSYVAWPGKGVDSSHTGWLLQHQSRGQAPYVTYEYSRGRVHTVPIWAAIDKPFAMPDTAWQLGEPARDLKAREVWWPEEHFDRARPLVQIPDGQVAMLRRQTNILMASAHLLEASNLMALGDANDAVLLTTTGPQQFTMLDQQRARTGATLVLQGHIESAPALAAVEIRSTRSKGVDARTRFGITPPPPLSAMKAGEFALSEPVLLRAPESVTSYNDPGDGIVEQMLGTTHISQRERRIGVYWESYGFRPEDSVTVTVGLERNENVGLLKRAGIALNLATDPNASVYVSWKEPDIAHSTRTLAGPVTVQLRSVILNIAQLSPGTYDVIVRIGKGTTREVTNRRTITLTP